jgi:hypothetical protein
MPVAYEWKYSLLINGIGKVMEKLRRKVNFY